MSEVMFEHMSEVELLNYSPNLEPFLKVLCDAQFIDCSKPPTKSDLKVHARIQNLIYLAQQFGCPGLSYDYCSLIDGPHAPMLTSNLYHVKDLSETKPIDAEEWPRLDEFLEFVRAHTNDWLTIAASVSEFSARASKGTLYLRPDEDHRMCTIRVTKSAHPTTDWQFVTKVYDDIYGELRETLLSTQAR